MGGGSSVIKPRATISGRKHQKIGRRAEVRSNLSPFTYGVLPTACLRARSALRPPLRSPSASGLLQGTELRAGRKPKPLFRLTGLKLYRYAERAELAPKFQLPPRNTRVVPDVAPRGSVTAPLP